MGKPLGNATPSTFSIRTKWTTDQGKVYFSVSDCLVWVAQKLYDYRRLIAVFLCLTDPVSSTFFTRIGCLIGAIHP